MAHQKLKPREIRKRRIRKTVSGSTERPRLTVFRSNRYVYAQVIDDRTQQTLVAASSLKDAKRANKAAATEVGKMIASKAIEKGINQVVFDRNGYQYHGVIKQLAESAREGGLKF